MSEQGYDPTVSDEAAERSVLGAMILSRDVVADVTAVLSPEHLYLPKHQAIMRAVIAVDERGELNDPVAVLVELEARGELARVGGGGYLHGLVATCPTASNAAYYADLVLGAYTRRSAFELSARIRQAAQQAAPGDEGDLIAAVGDAHQSFISRNEFSVGGLAGAGTYTEEIERIVTGWGVRTESAMTTGLADLDSVLSVDNGGLVVVSGRTGTGKSIFAGQVARHFAIDRQEVVLFFGLEMTRAEMMRRDLAALSRVQMSHSGFPPSQHDRLNLEMGVERYRSEATTLLYDDTPHVSAAYIRSRIREVQREYGTIGLVIVDQIPLMDLPKRDREDQSLGDVTRQLKVFAQEFKTQLLAVTQLNRGPEERQDGRPRLADVRGSDAISHHSDAVILLHDPGKYQESRAGEVDLILAKHRNGLTGTTITLADRRPYSMFGGLAKSDT